jgi:cytochrome oxidase assembly protein ShyY1
MAVVGLLLVVTAHAAGAAQGETTLEGSMPMNFAGPLGITVAAIGLSGLVLGLWRFLRKSAKARLAAQVEAQPAQPRTPARTS